MSNRAHAIYLFYSFLTFFVKLQIKLKIFPIPQEYRTLRWPALEYRQLIVVSPKNLMSEIKHICHVFFSTNSLFVSCLMLGQRKSCLSSHRIRPVFVSAQSLYACLLASYFDMFVFRQRLKSPHILQGEGECTKGKTLFDKNQLKI